MTSLDDMRWELRERFEKLKKGNPMTLDEKYSEWVKKTSFDLDKGKWIPSLDETFTPEELVKLKGKRRVIRYIEDDFRNARDRLERAKRAARECRITSTISFMSRFRDYVDKALGNLRRPDEYGLSKEEGLTLAIKLQPTTYELRKETQVAHELMKGCNIEPSRVAWSRFGKNVLEAKGEQLEEIDETNRWRIVKKQKT